MGASESEMRYHFVRMAPRFVLCALLTLVAPPSAAHHSIAGQFDVSKSVTLQGTITKVDWINPHVYLFLEVRGPHGQHTTWALSTIPIAMLRKADITRESLQGAPGEIVTITIHPAFSGRPLGWVSRITYADGRYYALFE
jgi:hypothetical protein